MEKAVENSRRSEVSLEVGLYHRQNILQCVTSNRNSHQQLENESHS